MSQSLITINQFLDRITLRNPGEPEFHQAVSEVIKSVYPIVEASPQYQKYGVLDRIVEPERIILFQVAWQDDNNVIHVNKGYRVQSCSALGVFKGGLRFHPSVNLSVLKFLGFEQVLKNSLIPGLMLGGAKGGSDFDPKGRSESEIMRFCHSFMEGLFLHIGPNTDVPAGDIGVGPREIGYLFSHYRKLTNTSSGVITGKGLGWGGSEIRTEATGYGLIYFVNEMLKHHDEELAGKTVVISGSGNVAQFAVEWATNFGAKVVTMSDSSGFIHDPAGIDQEKLAFIKQLKNENRGRIEEYAREYKGVQYYAKQAPWRLIHCDIALPCATENEIEEDDALALVKNGTRLVAEGANMPSTREAIRVFHDAKILFGPGKAANAGGVAVSGLEMAQDSIHMQWEREDVLARLKKIMQGIHKKCVKHGSKNGDLVNYVDGANVAGFLKVADAMVDQGF